MALADLRSIAQLTVADAVTGQVLLRLRIPVIALLILVLGAPFHACKCCYLHSPTRIAKLIPGTAQTCWRDG